MPHFVLHCIDGENGARLRPLVRESHLAHVRDSGLVRLAGPLLSDSGSPIGSLLIVEAADLVAVQAFANADPYRVEGVFGSVGITPINLSYVDMPASPIAS